MDKTKLIADLFEIKKAILLGAQGGVTDTAWLIDKNETICERLDSILISLSVGINEIEEHQEKLVRENP